MTPPEPGARFAVPLAIQLTGVTFTIRGERVMDTNPVVVSYA